MSKFKCSVCGVASGKEKCFRHADRKPLKKSVIKIKIKSVEQIEDEKYEKDKMNMFWMYCFENLQKSSEISGIKFVECNKCNYHHLLNKNKHPELKYSIQNIFSCVFNEHTQIENDYDFYPIVRERMNWCLEHYNELVKESENFSKKYDNFKNKFGSLK